MIVKIRIISSFFFISDFKAKDLTIVTFEWPMIRARTSCSLGSVPWLLLLRWCSAAHQAEL